jgi:4-diphosphocytidyl-2-C-methyl-D-erythritol kinase
MTALRARAPGKVNLCLLLGPTRADGLHELVSVVESVSLADEIELRPASGAAGDEVICPGVEGPNLAARALAGFREATGWDAGPQRVTIAKRVPVAAGMAGGSADAAATLRLAARAAGGDGELVLERLAVGLGADVPAALAPGAALVSGAGEQVRRLEPLEKHALLVLPSSRRLATPAVFAEADRLGLSRSEADLAHRLEEVEARFAGDRRVAGELVHNDLEPAARSLCPDIDPALAAARACGADHALVSGSGPTVVGVFVGRGAYERAGGAVGELDARFPGACAVRPVDAAFGAPEPVEVSA